MKQVSNKIYKLEMYTFLAVLHRPSCNFLCWTVKGDCFDLLTEASGQVHWVS